MQVCDCTDGGSQIMESFSLPYTNFPIHPPIKNKFLKDRKIMCIKTSKVALRGREFYKQCMIWVVYADFLIMDFMLRGDPIYVF